MLWINIKNNMKLILRGKFIVFLCIISPVIITAALSSAFNNLLDTGYKSEELVIGYSVEESSELSAFINDNQNEFGDDFALKEYEIDTGMQLVSDGELDIFFVEEKDMVNIYTLNENSIACELCQFILDEFYREYNNGINEYYFKAATLDSDSNDFGVDFKEGEFESLVFPGASQYYAIVEIIYFFMASMLFLTYPVNSERRNRISIKFASTPASSIGLYLGKFVPCELMVLICMTISSIIITCILGVNWDHMNLAIPLLILISLAGTAIGIVILYLFKNLAVAIVFLFSLTWGMGFIGGSFETYMFSSVPENIKRISPIYYANRSVIETISMGHSDYASGCVIYMTALIVVCSILGCFLMKSRMEVE